LNVCSITQSDLLENATERDVPYEHTGRMTIQKYLRESYYHCIKCFAANFLAALMWRRLLNSVALTTSTHRRPERVSDETGIQVVA